MATSSIKTPLARRAWVALLVAIPDDRAAACEQALQPVPVARVSHVAAALERLPVLRPVLAVVDASVTTEQLASLSERSGDVGTRLVALPADADDAALSSFFANALAEVEEAAGERAP